MCCFAILYPKIYMYTNGSGNEDKESSFRKTIVNDKVYTGSLN